MKPIYKQSKGYRYKKGTIRVYEDDGSSYRFHIYTDLVVDGYWWCETNKCWVNNWKECEPPEDTFGWLSNACGPVWSIKAAQRHIRNHPEIPKGTEIILRSMFTGYDVTFIK